MGEQCIIKLGGPLVEKLLRISSDKNRALKQVGSLQSVGPLVTAQAKAPEAGPDLSSADQLGSGFGALTY